jgi:translation initiation factor IF-2
MAKVRVYELAKELNIDSKELVDKLTGSGLNVKNYMSTLDDEAIDMAKKLVVGGAVSEIVEEKRIRPTIIRRRKKQVIEPEISAAEAAEVEEEPVSPQPETLAEERAEQPPLPPQPVGEALAESEAPVEAPEVAPVGEEIPGAEPEAAQEQAPVSMQPEESPVGEVTEETPPAEEPGGKVSEEGLALKEESLQAPMVEPPAVSEAEPSPISPERQEEGMKGRAKKGKRKKIDQPARIVKRAEDGPLRELLAKQAEEPRVVAVPAQPEKAAAPPPSEAAKEEAEAPKKGKLPKKKGKRGAEVLEVEVPKGGPARHRKKEVFERADLFDEGRVGLKRKEKKGVRKGKEPVKRPRQTEITVPKAIKRRIRIDEGVTVSDLARAMGVKGVEVIRKLLSLGVPASINQTIDFESATLVAEEFGYEIEHGNFEEERLTAETEDKPEDLKPRPPVVTIMGHVDHGKTSLLDYIRKSNVTEGEFGGITQHIGAYYVETDGGDIVFLDTPGHEAFTAMRARGAKVTDIIVLVVAADDGVMPQTKEAVNHARAAEIPIVVAINKIDKPNANMDKVKRELAELGLSPEEWGGDTIFGNISAKTGEGVEDLLGLILLQAEILELRGNPNKPARGTVIEAKLDKAKGPIATVLVKNGTLRQGDFFICGQHYGRVRAMLDHLGRKMELAGPAVPIEIYGISGVPMAGDEFVVFEDERIAKQVIEHRKDAGRKQEIVKKGIVSLEDLFDKIKEGGVKELNLVVKGDVQGSIEALSESLEKLSTEEVKIHMIHSGTGGISESDIMLASASSAIIIGFNVRANPRVAELAEKEHVDIRYYDVIYNVLKDIRMAMVGLLDPVFKEKVIGHASIKEVFRVPKVGTVAGCYVTDGHVERNSMVRLLRDNVVVYEGKIGSLRRFKEDVKDVQTGYECGIGLDKFQDVKPGDVFEVFEMERVEAEL